MKCAEQTNVLLVTFKSTAKHQLKCNRVFIQCRPTHCTLREFSVHTSGVAIGGGGTLTVTQILTECAQLRYVLNVRSCGTTSNHPYTAPCRAVFILGISVGKVSPRNFNATQSWEVMVTRIVTSISHSYTGVRIFFHRSVRESPPRY